MVVAAAHGDPVRGVELTGGSPLAPPFQQEFSVLVELHDALIAVAVGDKEALVRQPVDKRRSTKMLDVVVVTLFVHLAEHLDFPLAVVRKLVDDVAHVVDDPHVPLRVVRAYVDLVRSPAPFKELVPLGPRFDQLSIAVD